MSHKVVALLLATLAGLLVRPAQAQIKQPGAHSDYAVELEPHLTFGWAGGPVHYADEAFGLGLRASIPLFHNGPVTSINNNMAITFGLDWLHFGYDHDFACRELPGPDCDARDFYANAFWLPVAVQWNFFVHPRISVFGEVGLALAHERWSWGRPCPGAPGTYCDYTGSDTDFLEFIFYPGVRFMVSDNVGFTIRIGFPHVTLGASFLL